MGVCPGPDRNFKRSLWLLRVGVGADWGLGAGWWEAGPFLPRYTANSGSKRDTSSAEWYYAAGIDSQRRSEGTGLQDGRWERERSRVTSRFSAFGIGWEILGGGKAWSPERAPQS